MKEIIRTEEIFQNEPNYDVPDASHKVYILLDDNYYIISVESTAFHLEQDLINRHYVLIDEGTNWRIHCHAQPNYLLNKYGASLFNDNGMPNFKYINGEIIMSSTYKMAQ